jgi:hypothetical protein
MKKKLKSQTSKRKENMENLDIEVIIFKNNIIYFVGLFWPKSVSNSVKIAVIVQIP